MGAVLDDVEVVAFCYLHDFFHVAWLSSVVDKYYGFGFLGYFVLNVFWSMSAKTGLAPTKRGALAVAANVKTGTITSSPGPMFKARIARCKAAVQLFTATACFMPR